MPGQIRRQHEHAGRRGARRPIGDRIAQRANRDRGLRVGDRGHRRDALGLRRRPGRRRCLGRPVRLQPGRRDRRRTAGGRRGRRQRLRRCGRRQRLRRAGDRMRHHGLLRDGCAPDAGIGTGGDPGGVRTGVGAGVDSCATAASAGARRSRAAGIPSRRRAPRGRPRRGDAAAAGCAAIAATDARVGIATDPPTVPIGADDRGKAGHRRPIRYPPTEAIRDRGGGPLAAQGDAVVADLDLVALAQRRRRRDLRAVDAHAGEAGEVLDVERAVLADQPRVPP